MEEALIIRLQNQDQSAMSLLYDNYSAALYGIILRIVKDEFIAEEAMQDCFVKIWFSFSLYDSSKGRLFTWMVTIARHVAIDKIRSPAYRQGRQNLALVSTDEDRLAAITSFKPECIWVKELTAILSADQRQVVDLLYFEGYSHIEVAKVLALPLGTVKTRVRRALQILRKLLVKPAVLAA
ncbi:RNA polymerase sigma factor [Adhaeribacter rhizoryzae]|uniref:Sigma-70 family RNA polymerase sigma factor n=1 Tax=Adhaeribacter rhizoryzae TaxID=2607907 RepID=A0A5M6CUB1_9BACT|nr:sigma-70 family RNA polymerase sigma factor [Adhaeribacter rhizoryzae]KAA5538848.1 sigma-70 family RNA polymerase sigma factor [Adhaeribacter rhizoryzae]